MIPQEKIDYIKSAGTDNIVTVIGDFVTLKKRGAIFVGLSPFNNERTPSFTVHPAKGIFKDFSSGKGGDVLSFLMETQNWKFIDALTYVAKRLNIEIGADLDDVIINQPKRERIQRPVQEPSIIPSDVVMATLNNYEGNALYRFLSKRLGDDRVKAAFTEYYVGSLNDWVIFWQVDTNYYARSGKYIKYLNTGKRCRDTKATWEHSKTKHYEPVYKDFNLVQCFFGEHLITTDPRIPIAIVESEKTAIIASLFIPSYTWIACGSKSGINDLKCTPLKNRSVTLYPDVGCYQEWYKLAKRHGFSISDKLERLATPEQKGLDIADFLL